MIAKIKLTDATITKLMKNMVVIVDTREQANHHIISYFDKKGIKYKIRKLDFGDYSCFLEANEELGLLQDVSLENRFVIEKKNSLEEISTNFTKGRTEFANEFIRARDKNARIHLMVEDGSWERIHEHQYDSQFNEKSFYNSMLSFIGKYDLSLEFVPRELAPIHIVRVIQMELKEILKE